MKFCSSMRGKNYVCFEYAPKKTMMVLNMRRKKLRLFWVCAKRNQSCLSMRWKKLCLVWVCAERNYSIFALSMRGTNDTFTENTRHVIDMLHINMHERSASYAGVCICSTLSMRQMTFVLMQWVYGERCFMREMRCFHTSGRKKFKRNKKLTVKIKK